MDAIEKRIVLHAPRSRVWRAVADQTEFGNWFGVGFPPGMFVAGQKVKGRITNPPEYAHLTMEILIVDVTPETTLSFRWHPYAIEEGTDYSTEKTTLVTFRLADVDGGTQLTIVESGFDNVPFDRRDEAFRMNDQGWTEQVRNIERHVASR